MRLRFQVLLRGHRQGGLGGGTSGVCCQQCARRLARISLYLIEYLGKQNGIINGRRRWIQGRDVGAGNKLAWPSSCYATVVRATNYTFACTATSPLSQQASHTTR